MNTPAKRLLFLAAAIVLIGCSLVGWTAFHVVGWARDLPNRIVIDGDAISKALGQAMEESYHHALRDGDPAMQLQVLNEQFTPAVTENADALGWIRDEYRDDIIALVDSGDSRVAAAAEDLIAILDGNFETTKVLRVDVR